MFTASGDYRKMIVIPENVEWKTAYYEIVNADLIATDLQRLKNEKTVETQSSAYNTSKLIRSKET